MVINWPHDVFEIYNGRNIYYCFYLISGVNNQTMGGACVEIIETSVETKIY